MSDTEKKQQNLLDVVPIHNIQWGVDENGKAYLIKEKTKNKFLKKIIHFVNRSQDFHIHLDVHGTAVWLAIDGARTVLDIAQEMKKQFGEDFKQAEERVAYFIALMKRDQFVRYAEQA